MSFIQSILRKTKISVFLSHNNLVIFLILIGIFFRFYQYFLNRSLWLDEAMLTNNILNRNYFMLVKPLDFNQGAPILFLFIQKTFVIIFGASEYILRFFPLVTGCLSLFLIYIVARKYFNRHIALISLIFSVFSNNLIYYSSEVKQYSSDVLAVLLILFFSYKFLKGNPTKKDYLLLGIFGTIAIWLSHPVFFYICSISLYLLLFTAIRKKTTNSKYAIILIAAWLFSYFFIYFLSLKSLTNNQNLLNYWINDFMPVPPWINWMWFKTNFINNLNVPIGINAYPILVITVLIFGLIEICFKKSPLYFFPFILPIMLTYTASGFHKYPIGGRLILFLSPIVFIIIANGLYLIYNHIADLQFGNLYKIILAGILLYLLFFPIKNSFNMVLHPDYKENLKPVLTDILNSNDENFIYIYCAAGPAFDYYAKNFNIDKNRYQIGNWYREKPKEYINEIKDLREYKTIWIVFSHNCSWCIVDEEQYIISQLSSIASLQNSIIKQGASAYLFTFFQ